MLIDVFMTRKKIVNRYYKEDFSFMFHFISTFTSTSSSSLSSNFHFLLFQFVLWAGIAQSVWQLATGRTVQGPKCGGGDYPHPCRPALMPTLGLIGTGSLSRGQSGRGVVLTTHLYLGPKFKEE